MFQQEVQVSGSKIVNRVRDDYTPGVREGNLNEALRGSKRGRGSSSDERGRKKGRMVEEDGRQFISDYEDEGYEGVDSGNKLTGGILLEGPEIHSFKKRSISTFPFPEEEASSEGYNIPQTIYQSEATETWKPPPIYAKHPRVQQVEEVLGYDKDDRKNCFLCRCDDLPIVLENISELIDEMKDKRFEKMASVTEEGLALTLEKFYEEKIRTPHNLLVQQQLDQYDENEEGEERNAILERTPMLPPCSAKQFWWHNYDHAHDSVSYEHNRLMDLRCDIRQLQGRLYEAPQHLPGEGLGGEDGMEKQVINMEVQRELFKAVALERTFMKSSLLPGLFALKPERASKAKNSYSSYVPEKPQENKGGAQSIFSYLQVSRS